VEPMTGVCKQKHETRFSVASGKERECFSNAAGSGGGRAGVVYLRHRKPHTPRGEKFRWICSSLHGEGQELSWMR
jgi:hypothetical protein